MEHLTSQEYKVAKLIAKGKTRDAIASQLQLVDSTLRSHVGAVCSKLGISTPGALGVKQALSTYHHIAATPTKPVTLSTAEREVIEMRAAGKTFQQIADTRHRALGTVLNLSSRAARKLRLKGTTVPARIRAALHALSHPAPMDDPAFR